MVQPFKDFGQVFSLLQPHFTPEQTQALIQSFGDFSHVYSQNLPIHLPHLTREQIRELDRLTIEKYGISGIVLMENAGLGAAHIIANTTHSHVVLLCGKGNNGGDGFVIARHLYNWGIPVTILLIDAKKISPESEAGINLEILQKMKIPIYEISDVLSLKKAWPSHSGQEVIVDGIFGTGLNGIVKEPFFSIIQEVLKRRKLIISLDIPSGLDANTGDILGVAISANITITFGYPKKGFLLQYGPRHVGQVIVVDIGIPRELLRELEYIQDMTGQLGNI